MRIQVIISDEKYIEMRDATFGYGHDKDSQMCRFLINEGLKSLNSKKPIMDLASATSFRVDIKS